MRMPCLVLVAFVVSALPVAAQVNLSGPVTVVAGSTPIERNAVAMILNEVQQRHRRQWTDGKAATAAGAQVVLARHWHRRVSHRSQGQHGADFCARAARPPLWCRRSARAVARLDDRGAAGADGDTDRHDAKRIRLGAVHGRAITAERIVSSVTALSRAAST